MMLCIQANLLMISDYLLTSAVYIKKLLQNEVQEISWIDGKLQLADCFTKQGALPAQLLQLLVD